MANEKEIKQLEELIGSMKAASDALVKVYPTGCLTLKYMGDDLKIVVADLKGRTAANEQARHGTRAMEGNQKVGGPGESAEHRREVIEKMNENHQEKMRKIWQEG